MPKIPYLYGKALKLARMYPHGELGTLTTHLAEAIGQIGDHKDVEYNTNRALELCDKLMEQVRRADGQILIEAIKKTLEHLA